MQRMAREAERAERARGRARARRDAAVERAAREVERRNRAEGRESERQDRESARESRAEGRETERQSRAEDKEANRQARADKQAYAAARLAMAESMNAEIQQRDRDVESVLAQALAKDPKLDLSLQLHTFQPSEFDEAPWTSAKPEPADFAVAPLSMVARMVPGASKRLEARQSEAQGRLAAAEAKYAEAQAARNGAYEAFQGIEQSRHAEVVRHNEAVDAVLAGLLAREHGPVVTYYGMVLDEGMGAEADAVGAEVGYSPESRHLVVDLELPDMGVIPEEAGYRYVKSTDSIEPIARPVAKRRAAYGNLISQVALKCIDTVFRSAQGDAVESLTLNGMLDAVDPATGQEVRVCLLSVRVSDDTFRTLKLGAVQPEQCLKSLKASVSRSPTELVPVKPLVELDMVDPRFIQTTDVMSGMDARQNLLNLSPNDFESLITNLFATMGLDTRQTRASRDGGVDCVAFDSRPIFGGKVVIQAKRYKNTVGVSAVRDLFGTVQNEGASKGILVTTSGYGKASFDFARGKPLELLDGSHLLHLLKEHAGIDARIDAAPEWVDAPIHGN